jgi:hypothetical protein
MEIKRKLIAIMLSIIFAGSLGLSSPAYAITNGKPDNNDHPWVCMVVLFDEEGAFIGYLTGTLLSSRIVLTAGHGTAGATTAEVYLGPSANPSNPHWDGVPYTNPQYSDRNPNVPGNINGVPRFDYHDVGIVVLDEGVPVSEVSQNGVLPSIGLVDTLPAGTKLDLVGYGAQYQIRGGGVSPYESWVHLWQRMYAPAKLVSETFAWSYEFLRSSANPGQGKGGISFGDSGGPVFLAGTRTILAVNSYMTNSNSGGVSYHQRIDIVDILSWINSFFTD